MLSAREHPESVSVYQDMQVHSEDDAVEWITKHEPLPGGLSGMGYYYVGTYYWVASIIFRNPYAVWNVEHSVGLHILNDAQQTYQVPHGIPWV